MFDDVGQARTKAQICRTDVCYNFNPYLHKTMGHTLNLCTLNVKETNVACKDLFNRLVAKEKNKKPAVIAVTNKLLKQVFGVVKNECLFDRNYYKKIG